MDQPPLYRSRYPSHDVLARADDWDEVTRDVVLGRLAAPPRRFFDEAEEGALAALADVVVPQDDRPPELRVPLVRWLDARLHADEGPGYRYEGLPPDREFWRRAVRALDADARALGASSFAAAAPEARVEVFRRLHAGRPASDAWEDLPLGLVAQAIVNEFARGYYAHPWAWNEIGFAGPVFPRIYARTARDNPTEPREEVAGASRRS